MLSGRCQRCVRLQSYTMRLFPYRRYATSSKTHYDTLGVSKDATSKQIKNAFLNKSKQSHPDLHPNDLSSQKRFVQINEAYSVLKDPKQKQNYDGQHFSQQRVDPWSRPHSTAQSSKQQQQNYTWGEGPFSEYPRDEKGRFGFYNPDTGRYEFDHPLGEEMKQWAENAKNRDSKGHTKAANTQLIQRVLALVFSVYATCYILSLLYGMHKRRQDSYILPKYSRDKEYEQYLMGQHQARIHASQNNEFNNQLRRDEKCVPEFGKPMFRDDT